MKRYCCVSRLSSCFPKKVLVGRVREDLERSHRVGRTDKELETRKSLGENGKPWGAEMPV